MKQVAIEDLIFFVPRETNSLGASTVIKTEDGKHYALYMSEDGALTLKETQMFHPKSIKKVEAEVVRSKSWIERMYGTLRHGKGGFSG